MLSSLRIDHDSYIAIHVQLHNQLRQLIISGKWRSGARIPGELQLTKHLNVSRTTVRIALQAAEIEGLITRIPGRGTFVSYDASSQMRCIGYVTRSFHNEIHQTLLGSVETKLRSANYRVIFSNAVDDQDAVKVLQQLAEDRIAGLLIWPNASPGEAQRRALRDFQMHNVPVVFLDRFVEGIEADLVTSDHVGGVYALTRHLIELGHRHIAFLTPNISKLFPLAERQRGYEIALKEAGLQPHEIWAINSPDHNEFMETDIYRLLNDMNTGLIEQITTCIQEADTIPSAIVCANDALAIITLQAIQKLGMRVPDDISLTGFDDISLAAFMNVPITTASQDAYQIGQIAAELLLQRIEGSQVPSQFHTVPTPMQVRTSTSIPSLQQSDSQQKLSETD